MPTIVMNFKSTGNPGDHERHFGYDCVVLEDRSLVTVVPQGLADSEIRGGRARLAEMQPEPDTSPPAAPGPETSTSADPLDGMSLKELRAYAGKHDITIGAKATKKDEILAVIRAAVGESMPPASA
jgi:hypothetical protein